MLCGLPFVGALKQKIGCSWFSKLHMQQSMNVGRTEAQHALSKRSALSNFACFMSRPLAEALSLQKADAGCAYYREWDAGKKAWGWSKEPPASQKGVPGASSSADPAKQLKKQVVLFCWLACLLLIHKAKLPADSMFGVEQFAHSAGAKLTLGERKAGMAG